MGFIFLPIVIILIVVAIIIGVRMEDSSNYIEHSSTNRYLSILTKDEIKELKSIYKTTKQIEVEPHFQSSSFITPYGFCGSSSVFTPKHYVYTLENVITKKSRQIKSDKNLPKNTYVHITKDSYTDKTILKEIYNKNIEAKIMKIENFDKGGERE